MLFRSETKFHDNMVFFGQQFTEADRSALIQNQIDKTLAIVPQNVLEQLPPINLFAASGHINGGLEATLRAEARDDAAAEDLREVVRGFIALARLQGGRNPQARTLLNTVQLSGTGTSVAVSVAVPASALEMLTPFIPRPQADAEPAPAPAPAP